MRQFPTPAELSLHGALARIAKAMRASPMQDRVARMLYGWLCDGKLVALADIEDRSRKIVRVNVEVPPEDWRFALSEGEFLAACGRRRVFQWPNTRQDPRFLINVRIKTSKLDELLRSISQGAQAAAPSIEAAGLTGARPTSNPTAPREIYQTGTAGRPSKSWDLIEPEFRRRWKAEERYTGREDVESSSQWAGVLIAWLSSEHPTAPRPKPKTLSNKLSPLLRKLRTAGAQEPPENPDIGRPK